MPGARILFAIAASLCAAAAAYSQDEGEEREITNGESVRLELEPDEALRVFRLRAPAGSRSIEAVLSTVEDLDLAISDRRLDLDEAKTARHRGYTIRSIEHVVVLPEPPELEFDTARVWFLHVFRTGSVDDPIRFELTAWVHREQSPLLREGRNHVRIPAKGETVRRSVHLPRFVQVCSLRAETDRGSVSMVARGSGREIAGTQRGPATELRIGRDPSRGCETWTVELRALGDQPARAVLEMGWAIRTDLLADMLGGEEHFLAGREGELEYDFGESERADFFFDVTKRTHAVELVTETPDGQAELYVARYRPPVLPADHISFAVLGDEKTKRLVMGGKSPLPTGRYWVRLDREEDESTEVTLRWKRFDDAPPETLARPASIDAGEWAPVVLPKGRDRVTFRLPPGLPGGAHTQLIGSRIDADLFVRRTDTGEVLQASASDRLDEYMRLGEDLFVPNGVGLLLDVFRWSTEYEESAGRLHLDPAKRPAPPAGFLPPYAIWKDSPRDRAFSAAVVIDTDDGGGSGIVVSPSGLVLTCGHILEGIDEKEILVSFPVSRDGATRQCLLATIEARTDEETDLALLSLRKDLYGRVIPPSHRFAFAPLGRARKLDLGDPIRLLGYPSATSSRDGGHLTLLTGIASSLQVERGQMTYLASDLPTSGGASGGGIFNEKWELVAIHLSTDTLAFSRPCERVPKEWIARIKNAGGAVR